ncbi:Uncharacterised protein [Acinetobacter baumannii]|nr:Uncharacterised protein [Acinetobacter baumannii]
MVKAVGSSSQETASVAPVRSKCSVFRDPATCLALLNSNRIASKLTRQPRLTNASTMLALSSCRRAIWRMCCGVLTSISRQRNSR